MDRKVEGASDAIEEYVRLRRREKQLRTEANDLKSQAEKLRLEIIESAGVDIEAEPPDEKEVTEVTIGGRVFLRITQSGSDRVNPEKVRKLFPQIVPKVTDRGITTTVTIEDNDDGRT